jgi:signal transduction histidine kinase
VREDDHSKPKNERFPHRPTITGDREMLRLALVNLIADALKFMRGRPQADSGSRRDVLLCAAKIEF